jgi:hypothetical protein
MTLQGLSLRAAVYRQTAATVFILLPWMKLFIAASLKICTPLLSTDSGILCSPAKPCIMRFPSTQSVTISLHPSLTSSHTFSKRLLPIFSPPTCSLERRSHTLRRSRPRAHKTTLHDRRPRRALSKLDLRHYRRLLHDSTTSLTDSIFDLGRGASFVWAKSSCLRGPDRRRWARHRCRGTNWPDGAEWVGPFDLWGIWGSPHGGWVLGLAASWGAWLVTPQCIDRREIIGVIAVVV